MDSRICQTSTASPAERGNSHCISKKDRADGLTWIYRFQTTRASDGKRVENTRAIGLVKDIGPSEAAAWREIGHLGLDNNMGQRNGSNPTFRELADHFRKHELKKKCGIGVKARETVATAELLLDKWILPRWGERKAAEIKQIRAWSGRWLSCTPQQL